MKNNGVYIYAHTMKKKRDAAPAVSRTGWVLFSDAVQKSLCVLPVFQNDGFGVSCLGDPCVVHAPVVFVEVPDKLHKLRIKPFRTIPAHIRPGFAIVGDDPLSHTRQALPPVVIQINNGVAVLEPQRHGAAEIAVDDPLNCTL